MLCPACPKKTVTLRYVDTKLESYDKILRRHSVFFVLLVSCPRDEERHPLEPVRVHAMDGRVVAILGHRPRGGARGRRGGYSNGPLRAGPRGTREPDGKVSPRAVNGTRRVLNAAGHDR